jgi:hypothetical protein
MAVWRKDDDEQVELHAVQQIVVVGKGVRVWRVAGGKRFRLVPVAVGEGDQLNLFGKLADERRVLVGKGAAAEDSST